MKAEIQDVEPITAVAVQPESVQAGLAPMVQAAMSGRMTPKALWQILDTLIQKA